MNKAQMRDVRNCPECGAEKGSACRKPSCPQLGPVCKKSEDGKHHYKFVGTNGRRVEYYECVHCYEPMDKMHFDPI